MKRVGFIPGVVLVAFFWTSGTPLIAQEEPDPMVEPLRSFLGSHPESLSARESFRARTEAVGGGGRIPDPEVSYSQGEARSNSLTLFPTARATGLPVKKSEWRVTQGIPFPGKPYLQKEVLRKEAALEAIEVIVKENDLALRYLSLESEKRKLNASLLLTGQFESKARILVDSVRIRYGSGKTSLADASRAKLLRDQFHEKNLSYSGALKELSHSLDYFGTTGAADESNGGSQLLLFTRELRENMDPLFEDEKMATGLSPDLQASLVRVAYRQKKEALAGMDYYPDIAIFSAAGKSHGESLLPSTTTQSESYYSAGVTLRVPLWSFFYARRSVASAKSDRKAEELTRDSKLQNFIHTLQSERALLTTLEDRIAIYKTRLLPAGEIAQKSATDSYAAGLSIFSNVIDTWKDLYNLNIELLQLEKEREESIYRISSMLDLFHHLPHWRKKP